MNDDERIEAAALAMARNEGDVSADAKVRGLTTYRDFAREALAAADAVSAGTARPSDAVTTQEIIEQREAGWPDFHPEKFCHLCGRRNLHSWYVDAPLWNAAHVEDEQERQGFCRSGIVCPQCFEALLEAAGGGHCTWELRPDPDTMHHLRDDLRSALDKALSLRPESE